MAARALVELTKRTIVDALLLSREPSEAVVDAPGSDCSSWEDLDHSTHVQPPLASNFDVSVRSVEETDAEKQGLHHSSSDAKQPAARSSLATNGANDRTASVRTLSDQSSKTDVKRASFSEPRWTDEYTVKENDTLVSIAANFDVIPTMLKKGNRLTVDYVYPGQILRVPPVPGKVSQSPSTVGSSSSSVFLSDRTAGGSSMGSLASPKPSDVVLSSAASASASAAAAAASTSWAPATSSSAYMSNAGRNSSAADDGNRVAEASCQFVKLNAKYITECDGAVSGTLLVTPNAVMFDPNLSDRCVIEYGAELYGVMVPMEMLMGAAIYQDADAMDYERQHKANPAMPKPEVYHGNSATVTSAGFVPPTATADSCVSKVAAHESSSQPNSPAVPACAPGALEVCELQPSNDRTSSQRGVAQHLATSDKMAVAPALNDRWQAAIKQSVTDANSGDVCKQEIVFDLGDAEFDGGDSTLVAGSPPTTAATSDPRSTQCSKEDFAYGESTSASTPAPTVSDDMETRGLPIPMTTRRRHSGPALSDISAAASAASFFTPPGLQSFVDFESGLFARIDSKSSGVHTESSPAGKVLEVPVERRRHTSAQEVARPTSSTCTFKNEAGDKSDIFQIVDELLVRQSDGKLSNAKSLYLCLKVGVPLNKGHVHASHPIESYNRQQKPIYWFSIPFDKAQALYSFFVESTPEVYDTGDFDPTERGFIPMSDLSPTVREETFCVGHPKNNKKLVRQLTKDWEIISISELKIRQTLLDAEKNLPLPAMDTKSSIITEDHLKELVGALPLRVDGCPLHLVFGTEQHGFSLSKMYRNMQDIDSPILLVIQDTADRVFGAFVSSPFNISEHFCGTGESFLFTFVGGFKVYTWSGENDLFCRSSLDNLWIGSGEGTFGLYLDGDIYKGRTQQCKTFDNAPLTGGEEEFVVNKMEAWYFYG